MYTAIIQADGVRNDADEPVLPGTVIFHADAWQLCLPAELNFMGLPPKATPGDEETAAKVHAEVAARLPEMAAEKRILQKRLDSLAVKYAAAINKTTGDFGRNSKGELPKELDSVAVHIITLAQNRGMKPTLAAEANPAT